MKLLKISLVVITALALCSALYIVFAFFRFGDADYEFAQKQASGGRSYMDSMTEADYRNTAIFADSLMASASPKADDSILAPDSKRIPPEWQTSGIVGIRYRSNSVSFMWRGGAHAHTMLVADRIDDGSVKLSAHYNDHTPRKQLRILNMAELRGAKE